MNKKTITILDNILFVMCIIYFLCIIFGTIPAFMYFMKCTSGG